MTGTGDTAPEAWRRCKKRDGRTRAQDEKSGMRRLRYAAEDEEVQRGATTL
jgi:hypothetical protein